MCRWVRFAFLRIVPVVAAAAATMTDTACAQTPQAGAAIQITLDAEAVEIIRAARRQRGIDPPDAAADVRVAELLRRVASSAAPAASMPARAAPQPTAPANP